MSVVGKADSLPYAASLLDREAWQCEQIALLAKKTFVSTSVVSRRISVWLPIPSSAFLALNNKVINF